MFNYLYLRNDTLFQVAIWEIKNPSLKSIEYSKINQGINLDTIEFWAGETLDKGSSPETTVRYGKFFKNSVNISVDDQSKVEKLIETPNYKWFYGTVNKFSLNGDDKPLVVVRFPSTNEPCLVLRYKGQKSFCVLTVCSIKPVDESILEIFNFEPSNWE